MIDKKKQVLIFALVALVQLYVPAKMIWNQENILESGTEYKFKTAPVDPNDPFRGKYITLTFQESSYKVQDEMDWKHGEEIYVYLKSDKNGFAKISSISKEELNEKENFVKASIQFVTRNGDNELSIDFPFDRYYMEESKAFDAELTYQKSQLDTTKTTYALIRIKNGDAVLKDVLIDGVPIKEIVKKEQEKNQLQE